MNAHDPRSNTTASALQSTTHPFTLSSLICRGQLMSAQTFCRHGSERQRSDMEETHCSPTWKPCGRGRFDSIFPVTLFKGPDAPFCPYRPRFGPGSVALPRWFEMQNSSDPGQCSSRWGDCAASFWDAGPRKRVQLIYLVTECPSLLEMAAEAGVPHPAQGRTVATERTLVRSLASALRAISLRPTDASRECRP